MLQWLLLNCNQTWQVNFLANYNNLVSQVRGLMRPWNFWKYFSLRNEIYWWNRSHFWWRVLLNRALTSTQFHSTPPSSTQLISTSTQLHPPPLSSLQHPQQYLNQNITCNWAISPNFGRKIKNYPFWLNIGTHGILQVLIPIPDLDVWNSQPKIHFWANLGRKISNISFLRSQSCSFSLKFGTPTDTRRVSRRCSFLFWY